MSLKKKILAGTILSLAVSSVFSAAVFAKTGVYDVIADSLSVRTGPGTQYAIVATVYNGTDVVSTTAKGYTDSNGFRFVQYYYPKSSIGKYSSSAIGYIAAQEISTQEIYTKYTTEAKGTADPTYVYSDIALTKEVDEFPKGRYFQENDRDSTLQAEDSNPNAWRVTTINSGSALVYINGWKANAE
ncbi:hypothetical protein HPY28_27110 [Brevibacillus sp. HB1.2]|uniref:Surface layer protein A domain-containing protein n=1 Tax=Brevibacillus porteri TaxID=2126350 RepID=A0ABX5FRE1_9BACL|nr:MULTISPECIES: hypothetical protein [Brevibacillus]MED1797138.1 hypothetical protein [Brevibacillus porteri]MED2133372.1 hypothetical protein [Brevibacillus porteri]MED2746369.1 hypothetical protein [Brevibacillus porteri]MED2815122.1 hypothetical protein [Brevibacillus porteri]MED2892719.1 hypothetical protein [Brevibacillus porteri]